VGWFVFFWGFLGGRGGKGGRSYFCFFWGLVSFFVFVFLVFCFVIAWAAFFFFFFLYGFLFFLIFFFFFFSLFLAFVGCVCWVRVVHSVMYWVCRNSSNMNMGSPPAAVGRRTHRSPRSGSGVGRGRADGRAQPTWGSRFRRTVPSGGPGDGSRCDGLGTCGHGHGLWHYDPGDRPGRGWRRNRGDQARHRGWPGSRVSSDLVRSPSAAEAAGRRPVPAGTGWPRRSAVSAASQNQRPALTFGLLTARPGESGSSASRRHRAARLGSARRICPTASGFPLAVWSRGAVTSRDR